MKNLIFILKNINFNKKLSFAEYLEKVRISMGNLWNENYINPTRYFFDTLYVEWNELLKENENEEVINKISILKNAYLIFDLLGIKNFYSKSSSKSP